MVRTTTLLLALAPCFLVGGCSDDGDPPPPDATADATSQPDTAPRPDVANPNVARCKELIGDYADSLEDARACDPLVKKLSCTLAVDDELSCPCPTLVNPENDRNVKQLQTLKTEWAELGCAGALRVQCDQGPCYTPSSATCVGAPKGGGVGACTDDKD